MHFIFTLMSAASLVTIVQGTYRPGKVYITDHCLNYYMLVSRDKLIEISHLPLLLPNMRCSLKLQPNRGDGIVARVVEYRLSPLYTDPQVCRYESIQLANASDPFLFGNSSYCRSYGPKGQFNLGSVGYYIFKTGNFSSLISPDISLLVTEWFDKNITGHCNGGQFDCLRENICIDNSLTCNGYDDCGNNRDENDCGTSPGNVAVAVIAPIVFVLFILCVGCRVYRIRWRRRGYVQQR